MSTVRMFKEVGAFAENKDKARAIRIDTILPEVELGKTVTLDFKGVSLSTQSFMHALISEVIRSTGPDALDLMVFKNCNDNVKGLVSIVVEYSQASIDPTEDVEGTSEG